MAQRKRSRLAFASDLDASPPNVLKRLCCREIDFNTRSSAADFRRKLPRFAQPRFLRQLDSDHSKILDKDPRLAETFRRPATPCTLLPCGPVLIVHYSSGLCAAFHIGSGKHLGFLNHSGHEFIRSVWYNRLENAVVTVSVRREDHYRDMVCRSTPVARIEIGHTTDSRTLFHDLKEPLRYPDWIEFDDLNSKVITFSDKEHTIRTWDYTDYRLLYELPAATVQNVKTTDGLLVVVHHRQPTLMQMDVRDIETGALLTTLRLPLHRTRRVELLEVLGDKLLLKEDAGELQIVDLVRRTRREFGPQQLPERARYLPLEGTELLLAVLPQQRVAVWNVRSGEQIALLDEARLCAAAGEDGLRNAMTTAHQHELLIAHVLETEAGARHELGAVRVTELATGRTLARLSARECPEHAEAFRDIVTLAYNEDRREIYTATRDARIYVWAA